MKNAKMLETATVLSAMMLTGCIYKGAKITEGTDLAIGITIPVDSAPLKVEALNYLSGFRLGVDQNAILKCAYTVDEECSYFGCVMTKAKKTVDATVEPCESTPTEGVTEAEKKDDTALTEQK